jgi:glucose-1-phosphatase
MIKNIIFDFGGVLINLDYQRTYNAFKELGIADIKTAFSPASQQELFDKLEKGLIEPGVFYEELRKISSVEMEDSQIVKAWNAMLLDFPIERIQMLRELKKKYRLFLLSNTNIIHYDEYFNNLFKEHQLNIFEDLFEKTYFSHQLGLRKPESEIFKLVLNENKLEAAETLFIDDVLSNIEPAANLGINTLHLTGDKNLLEILKPFI